MKIANRERLVRKIAALPGATRSEIMAALVRSADEITALQRRFVPVDDGTLLSTIRNTASEADLRVTLTAGGAETTTQVRKGASVAYDYALGVEFGTAKMAAQPFFFPAYRLGKKRAKARVRRAVNKAARKVAAGK